MSIVTEDGDYDYVDAYVSDKGIGLQYKASELPCEGSDFIDDPTANTWSEDDVQRVVGEFLGIINGRKEIEVTF